MLVSKHGLQLHSGLPVHAYERLGCKVSSYCYCSIKVASDVTSGTCVCGLCNYVDVNGCTVSATLGVHAHAYVYTRAHMHVQPIFDGFMRKLKIFDLDCGLSSRQKRGRRIYQLTDVVEIDS